MLAAFGAARAAAENGDFTAALAGFDALAARGDLARPMRDYARLQAAIVLVNQKASADDIAARLARLFDEEMRCARLRAIFWHWPISPKTRR